MEKENGVISFIHQAYKLKTIDRAGWVKRGIESPEKISDHTYGTALLALILTPEGMDSNKTVKMALCHDLAESKVGDIIPVDGVSKEEKYLREKIAMTEITGLLDNGNELLSLWEEFEAKETDEAKFVGCLDKLDMMLQAHEYGLSQPRVNLDDFWEDTKKFDFGKVQQIYDQLRDLK
jgi:5'-deoxynucleotidase YfbR-like HD superfamily hydrolase